MDPELGGFISKYDMNSQHAHCNLCKKDIRGSIYNVKRHVKSRFHKQNVQAMKCTVPVDQFVQTPEVQKKQLFDDSVKDADHFLGLVDVHDASSAGQKNLIMKCLSDRGIPIQNLMGIGFDNASVNTGSVKGLGVLLKEEVPNLFILGCTSHSLALCATYTAKKLPEGLEVFIHDIVNYIASSPKRQDELKNSNMSKKVQEDVLHCRSRSLYSKRAAYAAQGKIDLDKNGCLESER
ncbi:hypothetical protein QYM36_018717 [Artemia franciscana]|uniref:DUF4371 domain-containing protein n=1 Tax=Artemia franciscana TaxID=6661 RepID=A0AA88H690_ARTSF|nr:hypothetical protein QYM36_018717 [Artemia franciscana]